MTVTEEPPLSPIQGQAARIIQRAAVSIDIPRDRWAVAAAGVVLAIPAVAAGLAAGDVVVAIRDRHSPVRWREDSDVVVCTAGCGAWPCTDRRLVDGLPAEPLTVRTF